MVIYFLWNNGNYSLDNSMTNIRDYIEAKKTEQVIVTLNNVPPQINKIFEGSLIYEADNRKLIDYFAEQAN